MKLKTGSLEYLHDRRLVHRTGLAIERHTLRKEHEAAWIVWYVFLALMLTVLMASCSRNAWAEVYDSSDICDAIYVIEGGAKAKKPYGILSISCNSESECRDVCLNTVENTFTRWQADGSTMPFLEALAARYAPIGSSNDPRHLNRFWLSNIKDKLNQ